MAEVFRTVAHHLAAGVRHLKPERGERRCLTPGFDGNHRAGLAALLRDGQRENIHVQRDVGYGRA
jgi:hypothetical protein